MNDEILRDDGMEDVNVNVDDNIQNEHDNIPSSDEKVEIPTMKVIPLKKICMTIGQLPTAYIETMSYYEMLVWFIEFLRNNVIPTVNNNGEAVEELQTIVMTLQNYINTYKQTIDEEMDNFQEAVNNDILELEDYMNNYFNNLDVQEEINNKLDQMLEDGVLEQIIEQFLQLTSLICFDNVAEMKTSPNLANGSYAKTLGYYNKNDGGSGLYKIRTITNNDNVDDMIIISLSDNTLVAELICDKYNLATLGATDEIDISTKIQTFIDSKDNITLYIPEGTFLLNIELKTKNIKIYGKGTIKGSIIQNTNIVDNILSECYNEINGISFTKDQNNYAIKLQTGRNIRISNIHIDNTYEYGIYYNYNSSFSQRISKLIINNNIIYSNYGIYLVDENTLGCADITFANNIILSSKCNVLLDGIDGFKDNDNTYFMSGYQAQSQIKTYNFKANRINWLTINGSTLFEAGLESIYLTKYQNVNIANCLIGWCGQRVRSAGIYLGDYDVTGNGLYNITNISNNIISAPSLHGISASTNTGRISINNNRVHNAGSSQFYYGDTDSTQAYAINYPLVNENMYCSVTNNICENRENNISQRIFKSNNITNSSKSTPFRLTEEVTISDTFVANTSTSKTISYSLPTGYAVNNIRIKTMDPLSHAIQYDITIIGNVVIIRNNYSTNLTTSITFEVEYVKTDSFI